MEAKKVIIKATDGLLKTAVNGVLWWLYLPGAAVFQSPTSRGAYRMFQEADKALNDFNYDSFKQIFNCLVRKEYINKEKLPNGFKITITNKGYHVLDSKIKLYRKNRIWDGYLYLIAYDIPQKYHNTRNLLRKYLKSLGCGMLQKSLWLSVYNPKKQLAEFTEEKMPNIVLLVSKLDKDGTIGNQSREELVETVYNLDGLNNEYKKILKSLERNYITSFEAKIAFFKVLQKDPQLPYKLLPRDWAGDKLFNYLRKKV